MQVPEYVIEYDSRMFQADLHVRSDIFKRSIDPISWINIYKISLQVPRGRCRLRSHQDLFVARPQRGQDRPLRPQGRRHDLKVGEPKKSYETSRNFLNFPFSRCVKFEIVMYRIIFQMRWNGWISISRKGTVAKHQVRNA